MKYLLMIYMNDDVFEALSEAERNAVFAGHDAFAPKIRESGEFIGTAALTNPTQSKTVRVRDGVASATDGPVHRDEGVPRRLLRRRLRLDGPRDRAGRDDPGRGADRDRGCDR